MKTTSLLLILPALIVAGCSTAVSPAKASRVDPQKTGLVLATMHGHGPQNTWAEFMLHSLDGRDSSFRNIAVDSTKALSLLEVPAGRYEIADWTVTGGAKITGPGTQTATQPFVFEVRPGEITYLGHFEVPVKPTPVNSGQGSMLRAQPILEDRSEKTVAEFRRQYPTLAQLPVHNVAPKRVALIPAPTGPYAYFALDFSQMPSSSPASMPTGPKFP